ncbi:thiaminphosphate pyrophosphorylase [Dehalogenimonas sp. WBC-2]|nr:thiaminphosphate pyrophosphorylase [Dehalogenimonas sp. WBC-2]
MGRGNVETAKQLLEAGVKIIQYREKSFTSRQKYIECTAIRELCCRHDACFIVNDDPYLALEVKANGLHLGQDDIAPEAARRIIGDEMLLGFSVTRPGEIDRAADTDVIDYLGVGPVYATSTKKDAATPGGRSLIEYALKHSELPVVAIGGIRLEHVAELTCQGVCYIAMVSELVGAADIGKRVADIRAAIAEGKIF